jgi:hypothetical protein
MKCDDLLRRLTEYEDGVLPAELCRALEQHFGDCPPCEELRRDLLLLKRLCEKTPREPMPEALRERLRGLLGERA